MCLCYCPIRFMTSLLEISGPGSGSEKSKECKGSDKQNEAKEEAGTGDRSNRGAERQHPDHQNEYVCWE